MEGTFTARNLLIADPALKGSNWISQLKLDWSRVNRHVVKPELGKLKDIEAKIHVAADAVPKLCKPRNVLYTYLMPVRCHSRIFPF